MKNSANLDPQRLLKPLCLLVLVFIPFNMFASPIFDFMTVEKRNVSWTVTLSAYTFILTTIPLFTIALLFFKSYYEKIFFRCVIVSFGYAFLYTIYAAIEFNFDLIFPIYGLTSLLGSVLVGAFFYISAR